MNGLSCQRINSFVLVFIIISYSIAGCVNLSAIQDFATISTQSAEYNQLLTHYVNSPKLRMRYQPVDHHELLEKQAEDRARLNDGLRLRHKLIVDYMDTLGQMAADNIVIYDKEMDALTTVVKKRKLIEDNELQAANNIAKLLTKAFTDGWRQRKLKILIEKSNDDFQVIVASLNIIVNHGFMGDIQAEKVAADKYYMKIIKSSRDDAGIAALKEWQELRISEITRRENDIKNYSNILTKISKGHQLLYENKSDLRDRDFLIQMKQYAKDIQKLYSSLNEIEIGGK